MNIKDVDNQRILSCEPKENTCEFNKERYIWDFKAPKCNLYDLKKVRGTFTFIAREIFFTADKELIHLKIDEQPEIECGRKI